MELNDFYYAVKNKFSGVEILQEKSGKNGENDERYFTFVKVDTNDHRPIITQIHVIFRKGITNYAIVGILNTVKINRCTQDLKNECQRLTKPREVEYNAEFSDYYSFNILDVVYYIDLPDRDSILTSRSYFEKCLNEIPTTCFKGMGEIQRLIDKYQI